MKKRYIPLILASIIVLCIISLFFNKKEKALPCPQIRNYEEINNSKVIRAVTEYNTLSFYPENGEIKGFHYELLQAFARERGWEVEVTPEMSIEKQIEGVMCGKYDLLANSRAVTTTPTDSLQYTEPFLLTQLVLIQRKPTDEKDSLYIRSQLDLANKKVYVAKGSAAIMRIENLSNEIGSKIEIEEVEKYGPEQLLALVAGGDIDYAVCEKSIAQAWKKDLPVLDMEISIGLTQRYAWGVNPHASNLLDTLNQWLKEYSQTKDFKTLRMKYYNY
ncbi:MAG: transporter substrate-binding domain-containing protein [Phocaeicola sp.]